ncbi:MAG: carboxypeptidase regulatory-like domain-containing protein [Bryobacteraceae bacterium]|nr:carboxypeptidase regulatory-like domain-containing protein [Bryobacteraceae bacterium]
MSKLKRVSCFAAFVFGLAVERLPAQESSTLRGSVVDATGSAVPGATVTATHVPTNAERKTATDEGGSFEFSRARPGEYQLITGKAGFRILVRERIQVSIASVTTLNLQLEVGSMAETVTVSASATPDINSADATVGRPFSENEIKNLPFSARNPVNLLSLQPGVVFTGQSDTDKVLQGIPRQDDREGVVNGVRSNQSNVTVDGANANDFETQGAFTSVLPVTLDSVQEFRVITAGANATDGTAGGAQIQLVTKSGSNEFHGNARWYHRNTATAANSFFNHSSGIRTPKLIRNIGGASVGGPVWRNRIFFFGDYEGRWEASEDAALRAVPSATLRQGNLQYRSTTGEIRTLQPADIRALDPAGIGVSSSMLRYLQQFPTGNDPASNARDLAFVNYRFNSPVQAQNNIYTARVDFQITPDGRHTAFWRGILADIASDISPAQFPGQTAASRLLNNSRGSMVGYQSQLSSNLLNSFGWAFTRQGIDNTGTTGELLLLNVISPLRANIRARGRRVPVHELRNDLTWQKGRHSLQLGGIVRFTRNDRYSQAVQYPLFRIDQTSCVGGCREAVDALVADGIPNNNPANIQEFNNGLLSLLGTISQAQASFFVDGPSRSFLPAGTPQQRRFAEDAYEIYVQDSWRIRPNLTMTAGLRYMYTTPISDTRGNMVTPTIDTQQWWNQRLVDMAAGRPSDASPLLSWDLAGPANGREAWYKPDRNNFAPRFAIAWSPQVGSGLGRAILGDPGKTSIRAGFGVHFQRMGSTLVNSADQFGSPGLANTLFSTAGTIATLPRFAGTCDFAGCTGTPSLSSLLPVPTSANFPFTPASTSSTFGYLVDNHLRNPYSMQFNVSVQRELARSTVLEVGYVGTLGRKLLTKPDFTAFYGNLRDPASGQTLWEAQNGIADLVGADPFRPAISPTDATALSRIGPIPFFENMMPNLPTFTGRPTLSPTQAFYAATAGQSPSWARALRPLDVGLRPGNSPWNRSVDPEQNGFVLFQPQFRLLPTWVNWGSSNYHGLQLSLRRSVGHALFGVNYVLSKSIDVSSSAESAQTNGGNPGDQFAGLLTNTYNARGERAVADFDIRHNFNMHGLYDLPFGKGQRYGAQTNPVVDAIAGNWTITGVWRWHSGFPFTPQNGNPRSSSEVLAGAATVVGPDFNRDITKSDPSGRPNMFENPSAAFDSLAFTRPGQSGSRNSIYGPTYFNVDLGVNKRFMLPWSENHHLEFRATAFNAFNTVNFQTRQAANNTGLFNDRTTFGLITETAGPRGGSREMEFALRYTF